MLDFTGHLTDIRVEDAGRIMYGELGDNAGFLFVRLYSEDDDGRHEQFEALRDKRVRVRLEIAE